MEPFDELTEINISGNCWVTLIWEVWTLKARFVVFNRVPKLHHPMKGKRTALNCKIALQFE